MKRKAEDAKKSKAVWTDEQDDALLKAVLEDKQDREAEDDGDEEDWDEISKAVPGKTPVQCLKRYLVLNKGKPAQPPAAASASRSADDEKEDEGSDEDEEDEGDESRKARRARKEAGGDSGWSVDEIELLKKLVEQYKDSKLTEFVGCSASIRKIS